MLENLKCACKDLLCCCRKLVDLAKAHPKVAIGCLVALGLLLLLK